MGLHNGFLVLEAKNLTPMTFSITRVFGPRLLPLCCRNNRIIRKRQLLGF